MGCDFKSGGCRELQKPPLVERLLSCLSELFNRARARHAKNSMVLSYAALAIASSLPSDEVSAINTRACFPLRLREPRWTGTSRGSECWESKCDTRSNAIVTVTLQIQIRIVFVSIRIGHISIKSNKDNHKSTHNFRQTGMRDGKYLRNCLMGILNPL